MLWNFIGGRRIYMCIHSFQGISSLLYVGVCIPDSCSESDFTVGIAAMAQENSADNDSYIPVVYSCEAASDELEYDWRDILFL